MGTRTIRRTWVVDDVLTDVTTAKLSDPTGTYGVKRNDTDAVVVADGVSMTKIATGSYEYSFTEPASGLSYTAYVEFVYDGQTYHFESDLASILPTDAMASSYSSLQEIIGRQFFGKRTGFSADETSDIDDIIRSALRIIYAAHRWSFLRPTESIVTEADVSTYDLPSGFDGIEDNLFTWPEGEGYYPPVPTVPWNDIRRRRSQDDTTGRPQYAAIIATEFDSSIGSKRQVVFYPTPDDEYTLSAVMRLRWTMLDDSHPYPIGGDVLAEAIEEGCLAAAERLIDGVPGVHTEAFKAALEAAILHDKEITSPATLGQDGGPIDLSGRLLSRADYMGDVTFNGVTM